MNLGRFTLRAMELVEKKERARRVKEELIQVLHVVQRDQSADHVHSDVFDPLFQTLV